jgi:hypothetical protein
MGGALNAFLDIVSQREEGQKYRWPVLGKSQPPPQPHCTIERERRQLKRTSVQVGQSTTALTAHNQTLPRDRNVGL